MLSSNYHVFFSLVRGSSHLYRDASDIVEEIVIRAQCTHALELNTRICCRDTSFATGNYKRRTNHATPLVPTRPKLCTKRPLLAHLSLGFVLTPVWGTSSGTEFEPVDLEDGRSPLSNHMLMHGVCSPAQYQAPLDQAALQEGAPPASRSNSCLKAS